MSEEDFKLEVSKLGIEVTSLEMEKLERYYKLLIYWNERINLTAIVDKRQVYLKHFYDSLTLVKIIDLNKVDSLCDLGTGAGFPGIVLKIFYPHLKLTLIDALNKRVKFLEKVIEELNLENITLLHERAEDYGRVNREVFDVVTARALTSMPILMEYGIPLVKVHGHLIAMRGLNDFDYMNALKVLNSEVENVIEFKLPYEDSGRTLISIIKKNKTNLKYPRKNNEIKKNPL